MPVTSTEPGVPAPTARYEQFIDRFETAFRAELAHFIQMAAGDAPNLTPPRAGVEAVRIAIAADQSRRSGAPVELVPASVR
jgi:myo-inositol 2-dehydrogenase/D-chiro-inositol 1-dehydrogenase